MRRVQLLIALLVVPAIAQAQPGSAGLVSPEAARQVGLERMWFTQLSLDRSRGRLAGLTMFVSPIQLHTVFQITHEGRRYIFSERDRNAFRKEIGVEGAQKAAEEKLKALQDEIAHTPTRSVSEGSAPAKAAPAPTIEKFVVPKITLYSTSERGTVHALDGETGRTIWSTSIGKPLYPTTPPAANDKYVAALNGSTLYVMSTENGNVVWTRPSVGAPGAGPAMTEEYIFVPMLNGEVESYLLEDSKRPAAIYKSYGRVMVSPVVSTNSVAWPTDKGSLYVGLAHAPGLRYRMKAGDSIDSAPAFLDDKVYATSIDGYIYCLGERKGNILWRFTTGEPISHSPIALDDTIYAISQEGNMYALDAKSAAERWITSGIKSYLAGNSKHLYCRDLRGDLAILDTATGTRVGTLTGVRADVPVLNSQTDRILLVHSSGLIQCLREINNPFPVVHYQIEPQHKATAKAPPKGEAKKTQDQQPPSQDTIDPFAPTTPAKPAAPPAAGGDPFGATP